MDHKEVLDMMSELWRKERSQTQMTLGKLIEALEAMPEEAMVANLYHPHSYRGYYEDLAFERRDGITPAADFLNDCRYVIGCTYTGYKGGEYTMDEDTPVWVAEYGCCGRKLMGIHDDGRLDMADDE